MVRVGNLHTDVQQMTDATAHAQNNNLQGLHQQLTTHGYILIRDLIDPAKIVKARSIVLEHMDRLWDMVDVHNHDILEGYINKSSQKGGKGMLLTGFRTITHHPDVLEVLEGEELGNLFQMLFGEPAATYQTKWVRVMGRNENTDEHTDFYRFAHHASSSRMFTCWIPLGDYTIEESTLAVCTGSHTLPQFAEEEAFLESKIELPDNFDASDYEWHSTNFNMGDVVVFDIRAVHASTANLSNRYRVSMDTRWIAGSRVDQEDFVLV